MIDVVIPQEVETNMDAVKITFGTLIEFEGREYVIVGLQKTHNADGHQVNFTAYEPFMALRVQQDAATRKKAIEITVEAMDIVKKDFGRGDMPRD